jgi:hypothetical protein
MSRIKLVPLSGIPTSYKKKNSQERFDISKLGNQANLVTPDMLEALNKLAKFVKDEDGEFYITDLYRDWKVQQQGHDDYVSGKRKAFMAPPGKSFHNAGRAVDVSIHELNFKGAKPAQWLRTLWDIAIPIGFRAIIAKPDMKASEAWHLELPGRDWEKAYGKISNSEVAKCCVLDAGCWDPNEKADTVKKMFLQSQLIRLGYYEIGEVDGAIGSKTLAVLKKLGIDTKSLDEQVSTLKSK